uniref:Uncharacterized protein LOC114339050 n=1 Tax=Diabrotica virgifera virgifera TaxID=50390 RepID=A0A6P7G8J2_DIAVI
MYSRVVSFVIIFISLAASSPIEETSTRYTVYEEIDNISSNNEQSISHKTLLNCSYILDDPIKTLLLKTNVCDNVKEDDIATSRKLRVNSSKKVAGSSSSNINSSSIKKKTNYTIVVNTSSKKDIKQSPIKLTTPSSSRNTTKKQIKKTTAKISNLFTTASPKKTKIGSSKPSIKPLVKLSTKRQPVKVNNLTTSKTKPSSKKNAKPVVHKVITKWKENSDLLDLKQIYKQTPPFPTPNPEVTSSSPPFSLNDLGPIPSLANTGGSSNEFNIMPEVSSHSPPFSLTGVPDLTDLVPIDPILPLTDTGTQAKPLSTFNLDLVPNTDNGVKSPCPSIHISSSMLQPNLRQQECSDLNLVLNSHIHQNPSASASGTRLPAVDTYDSDPEAVEAEAEPVFDAVEPVEAVADPGTGGAGQSVIPQSVGTPGNGGTGGTGGSGSNGDGGAWKFPDLRHLFEAIGYIWRGVSFLFGFLRNPYLYLIPMGLFFLLGFLKVLVLFPWWIPLLILYISVKTGQKPKNRVAFYQHVHKPVKHLDGWFWDHKSKTWQNVKDYSYKKRNDQFPEAISFDPHDTLRKDLQRIHQLYNGTSDGYKRFKLKT